MYSILIKNHEHNSEYELYDENYSLKNAEEKAIDLAIDLIGYYRGHEKHDYFQKEHPQSTIETPKYYCINNLYVYKIYNHYKQRNWILNEHIYKKIYTIKIVKTGSYYDDPSDISYRMQQSRISKEVYENSKILLNEIVECVLQRTNTRAMEFAEELPTQTRTPEII